MKHDRRVRLVALIAALILWTAGAMLIAINKVTTFAKEKNAHATQRVQERLDETLALLSSLRSDPYILSDATFQQKAQYLTDKNQQEGLGYLMLRILDEKGNIYREDIGLASDLSSREYLQKAFATGQPQVTDAFLAGADGATVNYTVALSFEKDGALGGALMAAILGSDMEERLGHDEHCHHVLIGSQMQYMTGADDDDFGLSVEQVLHTENLLIQPSDKILNALHTHDGGEFWGAGFGDQTAYYLFAPVEHCDWMVMTHVHAWELVWFVWAGYAVGVLVMLAAWGLIRRRG